MSTTEKSTDRTQALERIRDALPETSRDRWSVSDIDTILATVCKGLNAPETRLVLSIAGKYDLDPLLHEIWGVKDDRGGLLIMVGRDGLLRNARRQEDYLGFEGDVVREKDIFVKERMPDGQVKIHHRYEGAAAQRGKILGAWAYVHQKGKPSTFFFAEWDEYAPSNPHPKSSWARYPSAMILKCPLSLCLRLAYNISGVVGEDEVARLLEETPRDLTASEGSGEDPTPDQSLPPEVESIITRAEKLNATGWVDRLTWKYRMSMGADTLEAGMKEAIAHLDSLEAKRENVTEAEVVPDKEFPGGFPEEGQYVPKEEEHLEREHTRIITLEDLGDGESPPDEANPHPASSQEAEGTAEGEPVAQEADNTETGTYPETPKALNTEILSAELRQLYIKRQYIESMRAVGDEEEAQKDEALNMVDEQIATQRAKEEMSSQESLL